MMSEHAAEAFIERFEDGTWPFDNWHHAEHLVVAVWYLTRRDSAEAIDAIRAGIVRYNAAHGVEQTVNGGYHETITLFLARGIEVFLRALPRGTGWDDQLAWVLDAFGDVRGIARRHYRPQTFDSWPARRGWVKPDLASFDSWLIWCRQAASALSKGRPQPVAEEVHVQG